MIEIENFAKNYENVRAVDTLSLQVRAGELFGLIGPDGAGKTTTMRTLCTLLPLEEGDMRVAGLDVRTEVLQIRTLLGYMPQRFSLYPDLSVEQNLRFFAGLFGVPKHELPQRLQRLYHFSKLAPFKKRLAKQLSGGMKQKLALSCTLIHTPQVLVLDEPTTGVDPVSRRQFWQILEQLQAEGVTILVSTPYMDEALLCDRVAFMHRGRLLAMDRPENLKTYFPHALYAVTSAQAAQLVAYFERSPLVQAVHVFGDRLHISCRRDTGADEIAALRAQAPHEIARMEPIVPGMEDTFLALMHGNK